MQKLEERLKEARRKPYLPLLVIDSLLPGQRLKFRADDEALQKLIDKQTLTGQVGVIGIQRTGAPLMVGVTATLKLLAPSLWELRGGEPFRVTGPADDDDGVTRSWVELHDLPVEAGDEELSEILGLLVQEWRSLINGSKFEKFEGHLAQVSKDLGPMPPAEAGGERAMWVAALVNPIPAMGVAYEIRPSMLEARTVRQRLEVALAGIRGSIGHISGSSPLF